ncbi:MULTISPECIES: hypothetical protein [Agrobacterium]|uniref:Uncharacterized protein n=1 Tax=Agrobacterium burrii TaxID=2815339 RepID=A0ABS3EMD9_9HYPH|nr:MULTISPECIES: hypothetical protein [Agrobacterium]MBO0132927.1 hypothetical protein [Agrobacterium burrii]MQB11573.1 hypothetical protein [Agrobacterium sp. ICMP 6402]NTZ92837.1 hypothetical protein [Agrobacterium tumefaciens]
MKRIAILFGYTIYILFISFFVLIVAGLLWYGFTDLRGSQTYFEGNPAEYHLWANRHVRTATPDMIIQDYYNNGFKTVCVFPNDESDPKQSAAFEGISIKKIVGGEDVDVFPLGYLFRVYWVNKSGEAIVWNFDERRFAISFGPEPRNHDKFGCRFDLVARVSFTIKDGIVAAYISDNHLGISDGLVE